MTVIETAPLTYPKPATHHPEITVNETPQYFAWPARLLGEAPFSPKQRTADHIKSEYDQDKWFNVLQRLKTRVADASQATLTLAEMVQLEGTDLDEIWPYSIGDKLYTASNWEILQQYEAMVLDLLKCYQPDCLVEIGCGVGERLLPLAQKLGLKNVYGGEYTDSGVAACKLLAEQWQVPAQFFHANFYEAETTLSWMPEGAVVMTSHAIEQIPEMPKSFVETLCKKRAKAVIHIEPVVEDQQDNTVLDMMRRRYTQLNDYNRNLRTLLETCQAEGLINIEHHLPKVYGLNPLNPASMLVWRPV